MAKLAGGGCGHPVTLVTMPRLSVLTVLPSSWRRVFIAAVFAQLYG